ncbi:MAG TPA: GNAT family N-acetyltransferase [Thermohalobaculum sp.]|nr:GNAT family N-acetyltransferase [Thermohalobaculum sp.]
MVVAVPEIETERLILRPWREVDSAPFAAMNGDPEVRRFFPSVLSEKESNALFDRFLSWQCDAICFAAVERKGEGLVGMTGLAAIDNNMPPAPAVEIGWRFARQAWGQGYATEAARGWFGYGFQTMGLSEIISFAVTGNIRSLAVMGRLGMQPDPVADFDHPGISPDSPLRRHVPYRLRREEWERGHA